MDYELVCIEPPVKAGAPATLRSIPSLDNFSGPAPIILPNGMLLFL